MNTKSILLARRPTGMPAADDFELVEQELATLREGEVLLKTLYISVDPYMRGRMSSAKSYIAPYEVGQPIAGGVVAEVVESANKTYKAGEVVLGNLPWQTYTVSTGKGLQKIDSTIAPLSYYLGILGMPGLTAYTGLLLIGEPKAGETVVISGAAGAVGTVVGQIAKLKGCHVVGIAGSDEKVNYLKNELGFDKGINYKTTPDMAAAIAEACPDGVDVYFDNVGGDITDGVYANINQFARIVICGQIASYNATTKPVGPRVEGMLIKKSALMKGFIVSDYAAHFAEATRNLAQWIQQGDLTYSENIMEGFEQVPQAFIGLFTGENTGKQLVRVASQSEKY